LDGLAEGTQVSAGTPLSASRWSLPANELDQAFVGAPKGFSGTMNVSAKLYSSRNDLVQIARVRLEWGTTSPRSSETPSPAPELAGVHLAPTPPDTAPEVARSQSLTSTKAQSAPVGVADPKTPAASLEAASKSVLPSPDTKLAIKPPDRSRSPEDVEALLRIGERLLQEGDIAAARVALRRAAEAGSAEAARDLGMSFDPAYLRRMKLREAPDLAQAGAWYARARELGLSDVSPANERLATAP